MGIGRRIARKAVRKTVGRSVWRATHPVGTMRSAMTPRLLRKASRAIYTVTNPLGAAQNYALNKAFYPNGGRASITGQRPTGNNHGYRSASGGGVRAEEAAASHSYTSELMAVQREKFQKVTRPIIPPPAPVDAKPWILAETRRRHGEAKLFEFKKRKIIEAEVLGYAMGQAEIAFQNLEREHVLAQSKADAWWQDLINGKKDVLEAALEAAFADNPARAVVISAEKDEAHIAIYVPGIDVFPEKRANITPQGRLSSKVWTKGELNEAYAELIGAHMLALCRETWAVCPSIEKARVTGIIEDHTLADGLLFDIDCARDMGDWSHDDWGYRVLEEANWGLNRVNKSLEIRPWPPERVNAIVEERPFNF
jgi:hypothetical protein